MKKIEKNQDDDKIEIFEKLFNTNIEQKKLICLYLIIIILLVQTILPYILTNKIPNNNEQITENDEYDVSSFEEISLSEIDNIASSSKTEIVFIGRGSCGYCVKFIPILKQAQEEYNYKTYYVNLEKVKEEEKKLLFKYDNENKFIETNFGATPMVLSFKDNKMKEGWVGNDSYKKFEDFLIRSGLSK